MSTDDLASIRANDQYGDRRKFEPLPWIIGRTTGQQEYLVGAVLDGRQRQYLALDESLPEFGWTLTVMSDHAPVTGARNLALVVGGLYGRLLRRRLVEQRDARVALESRVVERTRELQQAHSFRKAMEDSLLVGMRARDLEGRIVYVNPAMCEMVGCDASELVGQRPPYTYWHPEELDKHWRDSEAALSGQAALTGFESRIRHRDGRDVHTMVYTAPLIDAAGQHSGWMSSVVDVTAQKLAQAREHELNEKLEHSERMAILGEISSTLAHELNQPLMALSNFASAAKAFAEQGQHGLLVDSLDGVTAQAQRAADIVRRVRDLIKQRTAGATSAARIDTCAINDIVENTLKLLQPDLRQRQARVSARLAPHLPDVAGDRVLLGQVLLNLVVNALQAMGETPVAQRVVAIDTVGVDAAVRVRVSDRGPGIGTAVAGRIFDPLFTTKQDGLGLGLNICRTIIESHGGRLWFENLPEGGAVFIFELRVAP